MNQECETYSLITIPWDAFQGCSDPLTVTQNIIIKALPQQTIEFVNVENSNIQNEQVTIESANNQRNFNEFNSNANHIVLKSVVQKKSNQNEVRYLQCKVAQPTPTPTKPIIKRKPVSSSPIKCPLCDKTFGKVSQYRLHMQEHRNAKKFKCEFCAESYNIEDNFKIHMAMHSKGEPSCPICNRKFQRLASLKSHLLVHQVDETFCCNVCCMEFEKEDDLNSHMETHQKDNTEDEAEKKMEKSPYVCSFCDYIFHDLSKYKEHVNLHVKAKRIISNKKRFKKRHVSTSRDFPHKCEHCKKSFTKLCLLERHRRIHTGERPFVCHICNRAFSQNGTLQIHLNKHYGNKPFECVFCSAKFSQKGNLRVHLEKTHSSGAPGEKLYRCNHCTCIFKRVSSLNGHVTKVHSGVLKDKIDQVDISVIIDQLKELDKQASASTRTEPVAQVNTEVETDNSSDPNAESFIKITDSSIDGSVQRYVIKQRTCGENRWYICSFCSKEVKKPSDLIRHMRIHTRERPFQCDECGQSFAQKSTLKNHKNTHTKQDYECVICYKSFTSVRTLNVHLRKHDRNAVARRTHCYKCSVCDKTFSSVETAKEHMNVHDLPDNIVIQNSEVPKVDVNIVMRQPMVETENGIFTVAAPKPKVPYATMEQYKNRPFKCHICNAAFMKSVHLKRHMLTHSGTKKFECELCKKLFFSQYALKEHMNYHTKNKTHECKLCKKKFYTNSILKRHMLIHSAQKNYICPYCKKRFKQVQFCRKHIKQIHKRDLKDSLLAMSETGELNLDTTKIMDLQDLDENSFTLESNDSEELTPIETYNNMSTLENKIINKEDFAAKYKILVSEIPKLQEKGPTHIETMENTSINLETPGMEINPTEEHYPTIFLTQEDLQLLTNSNGNTDPLLLSSINELQEPSILYPVHSAISQDDGNYQSENQSYENFNPNLIFNTNDISINIVPDKVTNEEIDIELNQIAAQKANLIGDNLIILNGDAPKASDLNYFNINFPSDFIDINTLNLPANTSIGKVMQPEYESADIICTICKGAFKTVSSLNKHECIELSMGNAEDFVKNVGSTNEIDEEEIEKEEVLQEEPIKTEVVTPEKEKTNETFSCQYCDKVFQINTALLRHISAKHKETVDNSCNFCFKRFKKRSDLVRHLRTHTGEKPFACNKCDKSFSLKSTLMSHYRTHNPIGNKQFQCQVCNTFFSCKSSLKTHTYIHTDLKPYSCDICSQKFRTSHHKKSHMLTHEKQSKNNIQPKQNRMQMLKTLMDNELKNLNLETGVTYIQSTDPQTEELEQATQHLISNELPLTENLELSDQILMDPILLQMQPNGYLTLGTQLEIGGQIIDVKPTLDENLYENDNEVFRESTTLKTVKENKFQCDICSKFYATKAVLNKHKRLLHGKYKCEKCPKAFDALELLEKHVRLHSGYRPFSCSLCANSFAEEASLKTHLRSLHNIVSNNVLPDLNIM